MSGPIVVAGDGAPPAAVDHHRRRRGDGTIDNGEDDDERSDSSNTESDDDDDDDDSLPKNLISVRSIRDSNGLEEAVAVAFSPGGGAGGDASASSPFPKELRLSTLLTPSDLAPLFDGARWAGTRVWRASIAGIEYLVEVYGPSMSRGASMIELGCGLGVPGMVWHAMGGNAVLTDQESILSQLERNVASNFPDTAVGGGGAGGAEDGVEGGRSGARAEETPPSSTGEGRGPEPPPAAAIRALPLDWSKSGVRTLLSESGRSKTGFDFALNCDCVYEPLYGESWKLLVDVIDELLRVNPKCVVVTSVERRAGDGIDEFLKTMERSRHVRTVTLVRRDERNEVELYEARGAER